MILLQFVHIKGTHEGSLGPYHALVIIAPPADNFQENTTRQDLNLKCV